MAKKYSLTPVEHEFISILWEIGAGSVHDILLRLPKKRKLAYTSVSTILRILQQKKLVKIEKNGRQHHYIPLISKADFTVHEVKKVVNIVFSGATINLLNYLVDTHALSDEEIQEIEQRLAQKKQEASHDD